MLLLLLLLTSDDLTASNPYRCLKNTKYKKCKSSVLSPRNGGKLAHGPRGSCTGVSLRPQRLHGFLVCVCPSHVTGHKRLCNAACLQLCARNQRAVSHTHTITRTNASNFSRARTIKGRTCAVILFHHTVSKDGPEDEFPVGSPLALSILQFRKLLDDGHFQNI